MIIIIISVSIWTPIDFIPHACMRPTHLSTSSTQKQHLIRRLQRLINAISHLLNRIELNWIGLNSIYYCKLTAFPLWFGSKCQKNLAHTYNLNTTQFNVALNKNAFCFRLHAGHPTFIHWFVDEVRQICD